MEQRKVEIREITLLQSFGIFLVVLGHSYIEINQHPQDPVLSLFYWLHHFIYSFHMPLFMFISGFLFAHSIIAKSGLSLRMFVISRAKRILLPYIIISSLAFPVKAMLGSFASRPIDLNISSYLNNLIFPLSNTIFFYWFLPTLFAVSLVSYLLFTLLRGNRIILFSILILAGFMLLNLFNPFTSRIFNLKGIAVYLVYFWSGCLFYMIKDKAGAFLRRPAVILFFSATLLALNYFVSPDSTPLIKLASAYSGIIAAIGLTYTFLDEGLELFRYINGFSYQIYLLSWFPQIFFKIVLSDLLHLGFFVSFSFMLAGGIIFPIAFTKTVERFAPYLGFMIGLRSKPAR